MFMADVICLILLVLAVVRAGRPSGKQTLGLFAYKDVVPEKPANKKKEGRDA